MSFEKLNLIEPISRALKTEGYEKPTPIQAQTIPILLQQRDLMGCAQTGTGKTAAFAIPILQLLYNAKTEAKGKRDIKALIVTPTRELAIQINESFEAYGRHTGLSYSVVFGGVSEKPQIDTMRRGVDILVATPGRLLDLMNQGYISLRNLQIFVLDEADRMLDMGFIHDVKRIIATLPAKRQSIFFSATMPPTIVKLAGTILNNPAKVEVTPETTTAETVTQSLYYVEKNNKRHLLIDILKNRSVRSLLVFTRTKHGADKVVRYLREANIPSAAIHGNKSQNARQDALKNFKAGEIRVLVATDIAARGIDVDNLSHVVNFDIPNIPETYVHRIGRTGRAGASGIAISFCETEERPYLADIHRLIGFKIPVIEEHPYISEPGTIEPVKKVAVVPQKRNPQQSRNSTENRNKPSQKPTERKPFREAQRTRNW